MSPYARQSQLSLAGSGLKRAIRFATYDWTRELPFSLRVITMIGMGIQGYAIWSGGSSIQRGRCHRVAGEANGGPAGIVTRWNPLTTGCAKSRRFPFFTDFLRRFALTRM